MQNKFYWKVPEYISKEKSADWYWALGIISAASAGAAFILNNFLFGIFIIMAAFTLMIYAGRKPRIIKVKIDSKGIRIDNKYYSFDNLEAFWIEERDDEEKILFFKSKKMLSPSISVFIRDIDTQELQDFLSEFLEEEEMDEGLAQNIMDFFGF